MTSILRGANERLWYYPGVFGKKKKKKKGYDKKNMRGIRMVNKRYTPRPGI